MPIDETSPSPSANPAATRLILDLGRALHAYGTPAHRLEEAMTLLASRLGVTGQFFSSPTAVFAGLGEEDRQRTHLIRVEPGEVNLEKMSEVDAILEALVQDRLNPEIASRRVREIAAEPSRYGAIPMIAAFALASASAGAFLRGGVSETLAAGGIGMVVGILATVFEHKPALGRVYVPLASMVASLLAAGLAWLAGPLSVYIATLAGLIALVPGLTLTVAMSEIATRNLVSGTARLTAAGAVFASMGFGVALGERLASGFSGGAVTVAPTPLPDWAVGIALVLAPLSFLVLFRAHPRDAGWILGAGIIAFLGARLGARWLGPELGVFVGALGVGAVANLFARWRRRPSAVMLVPGIILLVPGSIGFRSMASLLDRNVVTGLEAAFSMFLIAAALVTGLLFANVLAPPRRAL